MNWTSPPTARNLLLLAAAMGCPLAAGMVVALTGDSLGPGGKAAIMAPAIVAAIWLTGRYWRGLDEAAQEAQKSAGLWGSSFGMGLGLVLLLPSLHLFDGLLTRGRPELLLSYGGMIVALSSVAGFMVAWAWWWARRR